MKLLWPLEKPGRITSGFGYRKDPITGALGQYHGGLDLAPAIGMPQAGVPVMAAAPGIVITDDDDYIPGNWQGDPCGKMVILRHEANGEIFYTRYLHLDSNCVEIGQAVAAGQKIGVLGTTGASTGPHLHFDYWQGSANPADWRLADPTPLMEGSIA